MAEHRETPASKVLATLPPLPLDDRHWQAICQALRLSPRQIAVVELMLRDAGNKEIVAALGISEGTLKTQQKRIFRRTATCSRVQLAMRVLAVSHEIDGTGRRHPEG